MHVKFSFGDRYESFSLTAVARIQHALRTNQLDEAIALFRASRFDFYCREGSRSHCLVRFRDVWQTEKAFGYENIGTEEEFNLLREIYMTSKMDSERRLRFDVVHRKISSRITAGAFG